MHVEEYCGWSVPSDDSNRNPTVVAARDCSVFGPSRYSTEIDGELRDSAMGTVVMSGSIALCCETSAMNAAVSASAMPRSGAIASLTEHCFALIRQ